MIVKSRGEPGRGPEAGGAGGGRWRGRCRRARVRDAAPTSRSARDEHLLRGAAGEGEEEDALRRDAALDEVGDAIDERARLPGAGAGDDEQRAVAERGGGGLLGVQGCGELCLIGRREVALARAVEAGAVGHWGNIGARADCGDSRSVIASGHRGHAIGTHVSEIPPGLPCPLPYRRRRRRSCSTCCTAIRSSSRRRSPACARPTSPRRCATSSQTPPAKVLSALPFDLAVQVFDEPELSGPALRDRPAAWTKSSSARSIDAMSADQQADLFRELPARSATALLRLLDEPTRKSLTHAARVPAGDRGRHHDHRVRRACPRLDRGRRRSSYMREVGRRQGDGLRDLRARSGQPQRWCTSSRCAS